MNNFAHLLCGFLPKHGFAPEFDPHLYRALHPDLRAFDDAGLCRHYDDHGRGEGRIASPGSHRLGFLAQIPAVSTLEIGPAVRPTLTGPHVRYFDIGDRRQLTERALREGYDPGQCPEIDFVSSVGDLSVVDQTFECAFSSHCVEHQPDLAAHFDKVAALLKPAGLYFLFVPDKRYCFDALLPVSTREEVQAAAAARRRVHTPKSVHDHFVETTHNDPVRHWQGDSADPRWDQRSARRDAADAALEAAQGGYVDVHAWQFTPQSFRHIVDGLAGDGVPLRVERIYEPYFGSPEFAAILRSTTGASARSLRSRWRLS